MREVVLPQEVLVIITTIRRTHHTVIVLLGRLFGIGRKLRQIRRPLVAEFGQNHRALEAIMEGAVGLRAADPGESGVTEMVQVASDIRLLCARHRGSVASAERRIQPLRRQIH